MDVHDDSVVSGDHGGIQQGTELQGLRLYFLEMEQFYSRRGCVILSVIRRKR